MNNLLGVLVRCAIWLCQREASRMKEHRRDNDSLDCTCDACGWVRGIDEDATAHLGGGWR